MPKNTSRNYLYICFLLHYIGGGKMPYWHSKITVSLPPSNPALHHNAYHTAHTHLRPTPPLPFQPEIRRAKNYTYFRENY